MKRSPRRTAVSLKSRLMSNASMEAVSRVEIEVRDRARQVSESVAVLVEAENDRNYAESNRERIKAAAALLQGLGVLKLRTTEPQ